MELTLDQIREKIEKLPAFEIVAAADAPRPQMGYPVLAKADEKLYVVYPLFESEFAPLFGFAFYNAETDAFFAKDVAKSAAFLSLPEDAFERDPADFEIEDELSEETLRDYEALISSILSETDKKSLDKMRAVRYTDYVDRISDCVHKSRRRIYKAFRKV